MKSVFSTHPETSADPSVDACAPPSQPILVLWRTLFNDHTGAEEGLRWLRYFLGDTRWCISVGILLEPAVAMDRLRKWADQDPTMQEVLSQLQGRVYACSTEGSDAQVSGSVQTLDPAAWLELGRAHRIILVCEGSQGPASLDPL